MTIQTNTVCHSKLVNGFIQAQHQARWNSTLHLYMDKYIFYRFEQATVSTICVIGHFFVHSAWLVGKSHKFVMEATENLFIMSTCEPIFSIVTS